MNLLALTMIDSIWLLISLIYGLVIDDFSKFVILEDYGYIVDLILSLLDGLFMLSCIVSIEETDWMCVCVCFGEFDFG